MKDRLLNRYTVLAVIVAVVVLILHRSGVTPKMLGDYVVLFNTLSSAIVGMLINHQSAQIQLTKPGKPPEKT